MNSLYGESEEMAGKAKFISAIEGATDLLPEIYSQFKNGTDLENCSELTLLINKFIRETFALYNHMGGRDERLMLYSEET